MSGGGRQHRSMPSLSRIAAYWATGDNAAVFTNLKQPSLGRGYPVCFRCGWHPPTPTMPIETASQDLWKYVAGWLERAHLAERFSGGPDQVDNIVPLCSICHRQMPELIEHRDAAIAWINAWSPRSRNRFWQFATDDLWSGDNYRTFPGTVVLLNVRLQVDERSHRAFAEATRR